MSSSPTLSQKLTAEVIGTAILVFIGAGSVPLTVLLTGNNPFGISPRIRYWGLPDDFQVRLMVFSNRATMFSVRYRFRNSSGGYGQSVRSVGSEHRIGECQRSSEPRL